MDGPGVVPQLGGRDVRLGILLPTFTATAGPALELAERAAAAGLDGVFAYDHLWPMGSPTRPALAPGPILAAVAGRLPLVVGPLVARIGLGSPDHLVRWFETLGEIAPRGVIAALGTGDRLSAAENRAYGLTLDDAVTRREQLREVATRLRPSFEVWIGGGAAATNAIARAVGATLNVWNATAEQVAAAAKDGPVSWAGVAGEAAQIGPRLDALAGAGATWAVLSATADLDAVARWIKGPAATQ